MSNNIQLWPKQQFDCFEHYEKRFNMAFRYCSCLWRQYNLLIHAWHASIIVLQLITAIFLKSKHKQVWQGSGCVWGDNRDGWMMNQKKLMTRSQSSQRTGMMKKMDNGHQQRLIIPNARMPQDVVNGNPQLNRTHNTKESGRLPLLKTLLIMAFGSHDRFPTQITSL